MSGASSLLMHLLSAGRTALDTVLHAIENPATVFGYLAGVSGSIDDDNFVDATATTRTIVELRSSALPATILQLSGASIPNTNITFRSIKIGGTTLERSAASYNANVGGNSQWSWTTATMGSATDFDIEIISG